MDLVLEKEKAKKYIDSIQDEYFFKCFAQLLYEYETKQNLNPHTEEGLRNRLEKSMQDLENGTTVSSEVMRERVNEWRK